MSTTQTATKLSGAHQFSRETAAGYDREVIETTRVILVGCGALGQFIAMLLALIGFPDVIFVDMDTFEESNITRSPFYRAGRNKAYATAVGARSLCTATGVITYLFAESMVQWLGDALFRRGRKRIVVLSAVDSQIGRQWLSQRCRAAGVPFLEGGFRGERWNLSVFPNSSGDEPCWLCDRAETATGRLFSCATYARAAEAAGLVPATAPGAMTLAGWQVAAAVALLHGDRSLANCTVFGAIRSGAARLMKRTANPHCRADHRIVAQEAVPLRCDPEKTVAELLAEVSGLTDDPVVILPASFIRVAPCTKCYRTALIEEPEWAIGTSPLCTDCGGPFQLQPDTLPEQHGTLSEPTSGSILHMPLRELGLGPGLHLGISGRCGCVTAVLGGLADALLTEAQPDNRADRDVPESRRIDVISSPATRNH